jgi:hypothetical protein
LGHLGQLSLSTNEAGHLEGQVVSGSITWAGSRRKGSLAPFTSASLAWAGPCQRFKLGTMLSRERQGHRQPARGDALGLHLTPFEVLDAASAHARALRQRLLRQAGSQPLLPEQHAKASLVLVRHPRHPDQPGPCATLPLP